MTSQSSSRPTSRLGESRREDWHTPGRMSIFIAILGLALLILVHEAGHFFASLAVGPAPAALLRRLPTRDREDDANGIEYGIGAIPLGGFVTIPGMHRPIPHDAERRLLAGRRGGSRARRSGRPRQAHARR